MKGGVWENKEMENDFGIFLSAGKCHNYKICQESYLSQITHDERKTSSIR